MSFWKRLKNLWKLSEWDLRQGDTFKIQKLTKEETLMQSQFIDPVSFKEKFTNAKNLDDLLDR